MTPIAYFKLQAKNLLRDYKTRTSTIDVVDGRSHYTYDAKYFDIDDAEARLEIYKQVVLRDDGPRSQFLDYRLMG